MKILWSSDQHTLHRTTPTGHILGNLNKFLIKENDLTKVDFVMFGGDFNDRLVDASNNEFKKTMSWAKNFHETYYEANPKGIVIWLEGTSSHDWRQPEHYLTTAPEGMRVLYRDAICVDIFEEHKDFSILYVPDNMGTKTIDEIWELCLTALSEKGLTKVDMVALHGAFDFQLHPKVQHKGHLLERFESITKYCILAGHVHKPVSVGKLNTSGSFDRTARGEMHPKGGLIVDINQDTETYEVNFWENKDALPYVDIKISEEDKPEQIIKQFHTFIRKHNLPAFSQIAIVGGKAQIVTPIVNVLQLEYPRYGIRAENVSSKDLIIKDTIFTASKYKGVTINKENIYSSLLPLVNEECFKLGITGEELRLTLEEFL